MRLSAPRWSSSPHRPQFPVLVLCASAIGPSSPRRPGRRAGAHGSVPRSVSTPGERIGATVGPVEIVVDGDRAAAFAEAIGDPEPSHRRGDVAPLTFIVVPTFDLTVRTLNLATEGAVLTGGV